MSDQNPQNLVVHCAELLAKVRTFADETGQRAAFEERLKDLCFFGRNSKNVHVHLYSDFAPMSFYWCATVGPAQSDPRYMNGGLIYHGTIPNHGGGAPTFAVNLEPTSGWSIHT